MKMNGKRMILIISLLLVIGFASLSTSMFLNGLLSVGDDSLENAIYFDSVKTSTFSDGSEAIYLNTVSNNEFSFALNQETEYLKVMYTVANRQIQYGTIAHVECTGDMYSTINYSEDLYVEPQTKNTSFFSLSKDNDLSELITCSLTYALTELDHDTENKMYDFELYEDQGEIGKVDSGDQIKLGAEYFYVYDVIGNKLKLISKYNINNVDFSYQDKMGNINSVSYNNLYNNLKTYENKLHQMGLRDSISLDIITKEEIETFISVPNYFKDSVYWTKSSYDASSNWYMSNTGNFDGSLKDNATAGIRPVLIIDNPLSVQVYENTKIINDINALANLAESYYNNSSISSLTTIPYENNTNLLNANYNGTSGNIYIKSDGRVAFQGTNDNNQCVVRRFDSNEVEIFDNTNNICEKPIYKNLVKNGYGEYGDNSYFDFTDYDSINNEFIRNNVYGPLAANTYDYIKIDRSRKYLQSLDAKSSKPTSTLLGLIEGDIDKENISADTVLYIGGTLTRLTRNLKPGDTIVYLEDISGWYVTSTSPSYQLGFIIWNYKDSTGYQYAPETYSRNVYFDIFINGAVNTTNNTITLKSGWSGPEIETGTYLSQSNSGGTWNYTLGTGNLNSEYTTYSRILTGNGFRYPAEYVRLFLGLDYSGVYNVDYAFRNIIFEEIDE